jgi:hypothetical protein
MQYDFTAAPNSMVALAFAVIDPAALVQIPPDKLLRDARARLGQRLSADTLAEAIRWIALRPAGSQADALAAKGPGAAPLLQYAHAVEMEGRRPVSYWHLAPPPQSFLDLDPAVRAVLDRHPEARDAILIELAARACMTPRQPAPPAADTIEAPAPAPEAQE